MDTMADTCCAGSNWVLLELTGAECTVVDYRGDDKNATRNVPVATCCTVVREPATGIEYLINRNLSKIEFLGLVVVMSVAKCD